MSTTFTNPKSKSGVDSSKMKGRSAHSFVVPTVVLLSLCVLTWAGMVSTVFGQQRNHPYKVIPREIAHACPVAADLWCKKIGGLPE
jgi:hypothetical protein